MERRISIAGLARAALFALLVAAGLELGAAGYSMLWLDSGYAAARAERGAFLARLPGAELSERVRPAEVVVNRIPRQLHPYFGFTQARGRSGGNNHGFPSSVDYPYRGAPGEFVVGLFGGSVALQIALDPDSRKLLEDRILTAVAPAGFERVTLLNFANGGWRQPQSFFAFAYYVDTLDMAVVLDGFNEIARLDDEDLASWPVRFPWSSVYRHFERPDGSPEHLLVLGELAWIGSRARAWTLGFERPLLDGSLLAHCIWRIRAQRMERRLDEARLALERVAGPAHPAERDRARDASSAEGRRRDYLSFYESVSRWQALIAAERGVALVHFIQPNQYVRDAKPLSEEERRSAVTRGEPWSRAVSEGYAALEHAARRLQAAGIPSFSLADAFRDVRETVYLDDCCHLNETGRRLLAARMMDRSERAGVFELALARGLRPQGKPAGP
jgi:hypothetical protein